MEWHTIFPGGQSSDQTVKKIIIITLPNEAVRLRFKGQQSSCTQVLVFLTSFHTYSGAHAVNAL